MSKLAEFVKFATANKSNRKAPKTTFSVRIEKALKDEAQKVFGDQLSALVSAAIQDALAQAKGGAK
jgi:hypothetical protein